MTAPEIDRPQMARLRDGRPVRLAVAATHPVQYYAPLFRALAQRVDLTVFYAHRATAADQAKAGFGVGFEWDSDLYSGYTHKFLDNKASRPSLDRFAGCDTPNVGEHLRNGGFDALLALGWYRKSLVQAILAAKRRGIPVLVRGDSHLGSPTSLIKSVIKEVAYRPLLRVFDAALYVGARSRAYWRHYGYPENKMYFSPHCVDTEWFAARAAQARPEIRRRLGISSSTKVVLFAGKLLAFKRPCDVVAAAALLRKDGLDVEAVVAGAGPLETDLRDAAGAANVPLHMLGFCNQSEMPGAYAGADVLALPSEQESWGLVANEALACGCPVALSDAVGAAPDLADGIAGFSFPVGDIGALAAALRKILTIPPAAEAIRAKSEAYSLARATDGIVDAVQSVVGNRRA